MITPERLREIEQSVWPELTDARTMAQIECDAITCACADDRVAEFARQYLMLHVWGNTRKRSRVRQFYRAVRRELGMPNTPDALELIRECVAIIDKTGQVDHEADETTTTIEDAYAHTNGTLRSRLVAAIEALESE